jgi:predicted nucleotidyltransferase
MDLYSIGLTLMKSDCVCFIIVGSTLVTFFLEEIQCLKIGSYLQADVSRFLLNISLEVETDAVIKIPEYEQSRDL